eukprot:TRINITY_DN17201_c0_g1_i1.p1 TRINITY_DN17201_c0_g1~~TRINITY_DN17201_c0_g1_i1.p1  ORF type:complete len:759 (+),score=194.91 TRINITY_DN17201_c0_g1_i1:85-2361(+)
MAAAVGGCDGASDSSSLSSCEELLLLPGSPRKRPAVKREHAEIVLRIVEQQSYALGGSCVAAAALPVHPAVRRRARSLVRGAVSRLQQEENWVSAMHLLTAARGLVRPLAAGCRRDLPDVVPRRAAAAVGQMRRMTGDKDRALAAQVEKVHRDLTAQVSADLRARAEQASTPRSAAPDKEQRRAADKRAAAAHEEGLAHRAAGDLEEALECFQKMFSCRAQVYGVDHTHTAVARSFIATVLRDLGDLPGALVELREALRVQVSSLGPEHPHVAVSRSNIGAVLKHQGRADLAVAEHQEALRILIKHYKTEDHAFVAEVREHIGHGMRLLGNMRGAAAEYRRAKSIREKVLGVDHPKTVRLSERIAETESGWAAPRCMRLDTVRDEESDAADWKCPQCRAQNEGASKLCSQCGYRRPLNRDGVSPIFAEFVFVFTGVIPKCIHPSAWMEWRIAEQRGATVVEEVSQEVTHLIHRKGYHRSEKVHAAEELGGIHIVPLEWLYRSVNADVALNAECFPRDRKKQKEPLRPRPSTAPPGFLRFDPPPPCASAGAARWSPRSRLPDPPALSAEPPSPTWHSSPPITPVSSRKDAQPRDSACSSRHASSTVVLSPKPVRPVETPKLKGRQQRSAFASPVPHILVDADSVPNTPAPRAPGDGDPDLSITSLTIMSPSVQGTPNPGSLLDASVSPRFGSSASCHHLSVSQCAAVGGYRVSLPLSPAAARHSGTSAFLAPPPPSAFHRPHRQRSHMLPSTRSAGSAD